MNKANKISILFCIIILIICGIKWSAGLENHLDILLGDEAEYLRNGLDLFDKIAKNWGPTYNLWYKFLSIFNSHPTELYYINYKISAITVGLLLFLLLVRYNVLTIVAFFIAFCYLFSDVNINAWPRVSNFVLIILLLYFIVVKNISSDIKKLILFSCVVFIGAFARPELLIIAEISGVISILLALYNYKTIKENIPFLVLLLAISSSLLFIYGKPADSYLNINRTYIAFCQHYAIAYKMRMHTNLQAVIEWIDFTRPLFGDCKTVPQIFEKHFSLVLPHILFSTKTYFLSFLMYLLNFILPLYLIKSVKKKIALAVMLLLFIGFSLFNKNIRSRFLEKIKSNKVILFLAFAVSIPSIGMCMLIFPRQHYIMMQTIWVALLLGFLVSSFLENLPDTKKLILPLALICLFISPKATKYNTFQSVPDIKNLCVQKFIHFMNAQTWKGHHTIFSNILNVHLLFDEPGKFTQYNTEYMLKQLPMDVKFKDLMEKEKIDIIFVNDALMQETRLKKDTFWLNLTTHPEMYHFKKISFANECQSYLLIKE